MAHTQPATAFYVAASATHYLGLVALLNSLRLVGHEEPVFVGDCGLRADQRSRLAEHVTLVAVDEARAPHLSKMVAPLARPAAVQVLVDADIVVTRSLAPLIERARDGRVVAFADDVRHRFHETWGQLLALGELRRQPYVNSGLVLAPSELGSELLAQVAAACERVDVGRTVVGDGSPVYPFYYLDQDVLNAYLATYAAERVDVLDHRLSPFPPFAGVRILDEATLRCAYDDGVEPYALHHVARKPWLAATRWSVYSRLLARLLLADDLPIRLRAEDLPLRLRPGSVAWLEKRRCDVLAAVSSRRGRLGLRRRLVARTNGRATSREGLDAG